MPCFNGVKYLRKAIQSFIDQEYPDDKKELIIVGNKSTDGSNEIIKEFVRAHSNIKWMDIADRGISHASNVGIENAKGNIIGKLGADDLFIKGVFAEVAYYYDLVDWDAVYFNAYSYYPNERKCVLHKCPEWEINHDNLIKRGVPVGGEDIFFRRYLLTKYKFNEENRYCMDYELLLGITSKQKFIAIHIDKASTLHYFDGNITTDIEGKQLKELFEVTKKYISDEKESFFYPFFNPNPILNRKKTIIQRIKDVF